MRAGFPASRSPARVGWSKAFRRPHVCGLAGVHYSTCSGGPSRTARGASWRAAAPKSWRLLLGLALSPRDRSRGLATVPIRRQLLLYCCLSFGVLSGCSGAPGAVVAICDEAAVVADGMAEFSRGAEPPTPIPDAMLEGLEANSGLREAMEEVNRRVGNLDEDATRGPERDPDVGEMDRALAAAERACHEAGYDVHILPRM